MLARLMAAGALALGLLTSAPVLDDGAVAATGHHSHKQDRATKKRAPSAGKVARAMNVAVAQKGDPYSYGASGPRAFDCSGLVFYSFRRAGFAHVPRSSGAQAHFAKRISRGAMKRGDLMFFYDGGGVYHVGVYAGFTHGRRWVLHAPYSGTRVRTDRVWTDHWFAGTLRFR
jgi:cell wall-associated NlpC family hydrolase